MMGNIYDVEHLATFQLSEELNVPSDGMRRLLHMEKNGFGIWSQKMRIRLERNFIVILDFENGVREHEQDFCFFYRPLSPFFECLQNHESVSIRNHPGIVCD